MSNFFGFKPREKCPNCGSKDIVLHWKREELECIKCSFVCGGANFWQ